MRKITRQDKKQFADFCKNASDQQVYHIYHREKSANRQTYARIAAAEAEKRGINL